MRLCERCGALNTRPVQEPECKQCGHITPYRADGPLTLHPPALSDCNGWTRPAPDSDEQAP